MLASNRHIVRVFVVSLDTMVWLMPDQIVVTMDSLFTKKLQGQCIKNKQIENSNGSKLHKCDSPIYGG